MNLTDALKAVAPHTAPKSHTLPILTLVQVKDGHAYATDRYTMARAGIQTDHDIPTADGYYTLEQIKKSPVSATDITVIYADGTSGPHTTENPHGDYPAIARLIENFKAGTLSEPLALDVKFALKFQGKHFPKNGTRAFDAAVVLTPGETNRKPIKVTFPTEFTEDEFVALWVPLNIQND